MTGRHFLFIESNTTGTGAIAVGRLLDLGARVTFLAREPGKYPFLAAARPGLRVIATETNASEAVAGRVAGIRAAEGLDAVLTFSEFFVPIAAEVARAQGFRYLAPEAARTCRDKFETRWTLREAGLATPDFHLVVSEEEARRVAGEVSYPCVVKPSADSSSKGVRLVHDAGELRDHFRLLHGWTVNDRGQRLTGRVLVESLLAGPEVSVETVTLGAGDTRVVGITAKHLSPPPLFVEVGHDFPASLAPEEGARIEAEVQAALAAVGFDFGPAHVELRLTPAGPVVVEINPRLAGGMIPELVRYALGIDLLAAFLGGLCGDPVDLTPARAEWASIRFLTSDRAGRLAGVSGLEEARRLSRVREVTVAKPLGAAVQPAEEAAHRVGFVIASGTPRERVIEEAEEARRAVRLEIAAPA